MTGIPKSSPIQAKQLEIIRKLLEQRGISVKTTIRKVDDSYDKKIVKYLVDLSRGLDDLIPLLNTLGGNQEVSGEDLDNAAKACHQAYLELKLIATINQEASRVDPRLSEFAQAPDLEALSSLHGLASALIHEQAPKRAISKKIEEFDKYCGQALRLHNHLIKSTQYSQEVHTLQQLLDIQQEVRTLLAQKARASNHAGVIIIHEKIPGILEQLSKLVEALRIHQSRHTDKMAAIFALLARNFADIDDTIKKLYF